MRRIPQPEVPSIVRGHSYACMNRCWFRARPRDGFRYGPALGAPSLTAPRARFRVARGYDELDPRPRASPHSVVFTRNADTRFCEPGCRPTTSATTSRRTDTPTSIRFPLGSTRRITQSRRMHPRYHGLFREPRPSPLEEGSRELRAATALPTPPLRRCKRAARYDTESYRPVATPLAGDASTRSPLAAMIVGRQRWTARAEWLRAKDLPSRRLLPQYDVGEGSPPQVSYPSTP